MFKGCTEPEDHLSRRLRRGIGHHDHCQSVRRLYVIETVPEGLFAPMTRLATASNVFSASGITSVPAGLFASNPAITTFSKIFYNCTSLVSLPDGLFASNPLVTVYTSAF